MRLTLPILNLTLVSLIFVLQDPNGALAQDPAAPTASYDQAIHARDWAGALSAAQKLVEVHGSSVNLRMLADAQLMTGAAEESLATYDRALAAGNAEKPADEQQLGAWNDGLAKILAGKGNALLKLHRTAEAIETYNRAAELSSNPAKAFFNLCALYYNNGNGHEAVAACRKCLQADPSKADAWFILGSVLFVDATTDAKGKFVISADTRQALDKYLELAPDGPHAADVKAMLEAAAK